MRGATSLVCLGTILWVMLLSRLAWGHYPVGPDAGLGASIHGLLKTPVKDQTDLLPAFAELNPQMVSQHDAFSRDVTIGDMQAGREIAESAGRGTLAAEQSPCSLDAGANSP